MVILTALASLMVLALSWGLTCGIIYLITLCFSLAFSWEIATGIWLVLMLLSSFFKSSKSKK